MEKADTIQEIKKFMYDKMHDLEFDPIDVISPAYLNSVILKTYEDNSKIEPYSIISGDFNKLNDLNLQYGFREGDRCIADSLRIIRNRLPEKSLICRYGGDEFIFILPNITEDKVLQEIVDNINSDMKSNIDNLKGLTMSFGYGKSWEAGSLGELYDLVDEKVNAEKFNLDSDDNEQILHKGFETLYNSLRLSDSFEFTLPQIKELLKLTVKATFEMLRQYSKTGEFPKVSIDDEKVSNKKVSTLSDSITQEQTKILNDILISGLDFNEEDVLKELSQEQLEEISKALVFNKEIGGFTKVYFEKYLYDALPAENFRAVLLSLSGLKLSNLIRGHSATDNYLKTYIYSNIAENIDTRVPLCQSVFDPNGDTYKIAIGGGDLLYIEPQDSRYRPKDAFYKKNDEEVLLKYVKISTVKPIPKEQILDFVSFAGNNSKEKKDILKRSLFTSSYAIEIAKACIYPGLKKYVEKYPDTYMNTDNIRQFLFAECKAMIEFEKVTEGKPRITTFKENDIHFDYCYNDESNLNDSNSEENKENQVENISANSNSNQDSSVNT